MKIIDRYPLVAACTLSLIAFPSASLAAIVVSATAIVVSSSLSPAMDSESIVLTATVTSDSVPNGTMTFVVNSVPIPGCSGQPVVPYTATSSVTTCTTTLTSIGTQTIDASYSGDVYHAPASGSLQQKIVPSVPGNATVLTNLYGGFTATGAQAGASTLTNFSGNAVIQLGPGTSATPFEIDFNSLNLAAGGQLGFRSGAPGQSVIIHNADMNPSLIGGALRGLAGPGGDPPVMEIRSPSGMRVRAGGSVYNYTGLTLDFLAGSYFIAEPFYNDGIVDGGVKLEVFGGGTHGSGDFNGNDLKFHTFESANNPVHGTNYLQNYLNLKPGTGVPPGVPDIRLTLNAYGTSPQVFNLKLNGSASLWMPSAFPVSLGFPPNNAVIAPAGVRLPGVPEPTYGGGSMLLQATGPLSLFDGGASGSKDFVFPGAIALISSTSIDFKGVRVNQGWTNNGQAFQGIFAEAPIIQDTTGKIQLYGNAKNWMNFSTFPITPVAAFTLQTNNDGSGSFAPSDGIATHLNTYTYITNIAVSGGCWPCAVNTQAVDMSGPH